VASGGRTLMMFEPYRHFQVCGRPPVLSVSAWDRIDRKQALVVLKGVTMRPGQPFKVDALQTTLNQEDGLETQTRFDCDLF
jgi:hypothetical protein